MTRVTDEDLELLKKYGAWTTDAGARLRHAKCVDNVIAELLALRKVADAAADARAQIAMAAANGRPMPGNVKCDAETGDGGVMRDPERIDVVIAKLRDIWKLNPDMRLGQMVANVTTEDDIYHIEDSELIDRIGKVHCP